jgi:hypothetical protein
MTKFIVIVEKLHNKKIYFQILNDKHDINFGYCYIGNT